MTVYMDAIAVVGNDEINYLKEYIGKEFEIKDVGDLKNFGTEVA